MEEILNWLKKFRSLLQSGSIIFYDIAQYMCFIIAVILVITSVAADVRGANIGFSAGKWAITAGSVGALLVVARRIYGI